MHGLIHISNTHSCCNMPTHTHAQRRNISCIHSQIIVPYFYIHTYFDICTMDDMLIANTYGCVSACTLAWTCMLMRISFFSFMRFTSTWCTCANRSQRDLKAVCVCAWIHLYERKCHTPRILDAATYIQVCGFIRTLSSIVLHKYSTQRIYRIQQ